MITYDRSAFGVNLLLRIHGSAVYRSIFPGLLSAGFFFLIRYRHHDGEVGDTLGDPYAIGVLVATTTFLIVFRANQGYARYWEAAQAIHHMMSKWMDATSHSAVYHMQAPQYNGMKPPSFVDHTELDHKFYTRDRERHCYHEDLLVHGEKKELKRQRQLSSQQLFPDASESSPYSVTDHTVATGVVEGRTKRKVRSVRKSINYVASSKKRRAAVVQVQDNSSSANWDNEDDYDEEEEEADKFEGDVVRDPRRLKGRMRLDGNWSAYYRNRGSTFADPDNDYIPDKLGFASIQGGRTPPLFLQELAHLASLVTAVALSTLRNDIEGAESPLEVYEPGSSWPEVDPDRDAMVGSDGTLADLLVRFIRQCKYFLGFQLSPEERTRFNAARPLPVLGGVSDAEIRFLQMARGPYAKTQMAWAWLSELITREHLAGNMGAVGSPMVSRVMQFLGDGMIYYNHARKIMFIPFPFPHAQLSTLFVLSMIPTIPYLMDQYALDMWLGFVMSFVAVVGLLGINEVARELENPFRNVPNELPLVTLQAQFNEALLTIYAGYHPDLYFEERFRRARKTSPETSCATTASSTTSSNGSDDSKNRDDCMQATSCNHIPELMEELARLRRKVEEREKELNLLRGKVADIGETVKAT